MKIVVVGSGLIGSKLMNKLHRRGHTVVSVFNNNDNNWHAGEDAIQIPKGMDIVVDVSNIPVPKGATTMNLFQSSTHNMINANIYTGAKHYILLSVVGADRLPESSYMRAKLVQEEMVKTSGVPYSILRTTRFFENAGEIALEATIGEQVRISPAPFQPVAADECVDVLTDIVLGTPLNTVAEVAGPVCMPLYEFIRYYLNQTEDSRQLVEDTHAPYLGAELNDNSLTPGPDVHLGVMKYESWFYAQLAAPIEKINSLNNQYSLTI